MIKYLYKITQATVLSYLFLIVANLFNFGFGLNLNWYFLFVVLPLSALSSALWAGNNQKKIIDAVRLWAKHKRETKLNYPLDTVHQPPYTSHQTLTTTPKYLLWLLLDIWAAVNRYILNFYNLTVILIMLVIFDLLVIDLYSDIITVIISLYWILVMVRNKLEGRFSILLSLLFLPLCPLFIELGMGLKAEKSGVWVFMFLAIGVFRMVWEEIRSTKQFRQIEDLVPGLKANYAKIRAWVYRRYEIELAKEKTH